MKVIYLKSALKCNFFYVTIGIKIRIFRVSVSIKPVRSLLLLVTTNCLKKENILMVFSLKTNFSGLVGVLRLKIFSRRNFSQGNRIFYGGGLDFPELFKKLSRFLKFEKSCFLGFLLYVGRKQQQKNLPGPKIIFVYNISLA